MQLRASCPEETPRLGHRDMWLTQGACSGTLALEQALRGVLGAPPGADQAWHLTP